MTVAALAVVVNESRDAAHGAVLLELERKAMSNEDVRSWVARHVVHVQSVLQDIQAANRAGNAEHVKQILDDELAEERTCVLCRRRSREMYDMASLGRRRGLALNERLACRDCFLHEVLQ